MVIQSSDINKYNIREIGKYQFSCSLLISRLGEEKYIEVCTKLRNFRFTIPSWAVKEPEDIGIIQMVTGAPDSSFDIGKCDPADINFTLNLSDMDLEQLLSLAGSREITGIHVWRSRSDNDSWIGAGLMHYVLFSLFNKLEELRQNNPPDPTTLLWMISAAPDLKNPIEDLLQSLESILIAYARALLVDRDHLRIAAESRDIVMAKEILQEAFMTDVRPIVADARTLNGGALNPIDFFRTVQL